MNTAQQREIFLRVYTSFGIPVSGNNISFDYERVDIENRARSLIFFTAHVRAGEYSLDLKYGDYITPKELEDRISEHLRREISIAKMFSPQAPEVDLL